MSTSSITTKLFRLSPFIENSCRQDPSLQERIDDSSWARSEVAEGYYRERIAEELEGVESDQQLSRVLRTIRRQEMVRIAARDLAGWADYHVTVRELSALADAMVSVTLELLYRWRCREEGTPRGEQSGRAQQMMVVAMGKLGAGELNFSSDIDLIFAYPEDGETRGRRPWISNREFFTHLAQRLIRAINTNTADGFVFRVDMRLRPFGESGALVSSFEAMEDYYQLHGRSWERYAWIKGRVIAGDREAGGALLKMMRPFVYRRYIDYSAFDSLREMKRMIAQQVRKKGMESDLKLGPGGIREIEFIGQAFQLVRGGAEPGLQIRPILQVLPLLKRLGEITAEEEQQLTEAYLFLRNSEHRLQEYEDRQTQRLPESDERQLLLARSMGFEGYAPYLAELERHRDRVQSQFERLFSVGIVDTSSSEKSEAQQLWSELSEESLPEPLLQWVEATFHESEKVVITLRNLKLGAVVESMSREGLERLDRLMPLLIDAAAHSSQESQQGSSSGAAERGGEIADQSLERAIRLVESIGRRPAYFSMLAENRSTLEHLLFLLRESEWIAEQLSQNPMLLDGLMDPRELFLPTDCPALMSELAELGGRIDAQDLEQQMEFLRHFQHRHMVKVAAVDVMDRLPIMQVSDALTWIAESVVNYCFRLSWQEMTRRFGKPRRRSESMENSGFVVVGYGKLGGIELGYGSDLDLVFLHTEPPEEPFSRKRQPVTRREFYIRMVQRMVHMLTTRTMSGRLYEVDPRLRPNGASGLLVVDMEGFRDYQLEQAWTWEHQALVRARVIGGGREATDAFESIRREILGLEREPEQLRSEIVEMREKMRVSLGQCDEGEINIKQMAGGMVDIEFMVQYLVLRWASQYPSLMQWTDNIRLLEQLAEEKRVGHQDAEQLKDCYLRYRRRAYHLSLQNRPATVSEREFTEERQQVEAIWQQLMGREAGETE